MDEWMPIGSKNDCKFVITYIHDFTWPVWSFVSDHWKAKYFDNSNTHWNWWMMDASLPSFLSLFATSLTAKAHCTIYQPKISWRRSSYKCTLFGWTFQAIQYPLGSPRFEIVVTLTGASRSTGQLTQERTSYLPREILWGHRFPNIVEYDRKHCVYVADYDQFETTEAVNILETLHLSIYQLIEFPFIYSGRHTVV